MTGQEKTAFPTTITFVSIDDLGIDTLNVRGGAWDHDEELIEDVRQNGIRVPLTVRPADPISGKKYGIVSGSRRFNAAIEAGLTELPCLIEEMDDITAMGYTIAENKHRKDIPVWRYALFVGQMYNGLKNGKNKEDIVNQLRDRTGLSRTTIFSYLSAFELPEEIFELMKPEEERSEKVKELLKTVQLTGVASDILSLEKADMISKELGGGAMTPGKMFEAAAYVMSLSPQLASEIIQKVKQYPKLTMEKLHEKIIEIPRGMSVRIILAANIAWALDNACVEKKLDREHLVEEYVREGLKNDGFL